MKARLAARLESMMKSIFVQGRIIMEGVKRSIKADTFNFNVNLTRHNLIVSTLLWLYFLTINSSKGSFFSDEGGVGVLGSFVEIVIRLVAGLPLVIIDMIPLIAVIILIVLHFMDKPIKKVFLSLLPLILISHFLYVAMSIVGFVYSSSFYFAGFFLFILTLYMLLIKENKARAMKSFYSKSFEIKLVKYNLSILIFLAIITLIAVFTPFLGYSNEVGAFLDMVEATGSLSGDVSKVTNSFSSAAYETIENINSSLVMMKLPFLILSFLAIYRALKNKNQVFMLPLSLLVMGMITFIGLPLGLEKLKIDEVFTVSSVIKWIGYLMFMWMLFEMVFVREVQKYVKAYGKKGVERLGNFAVLSEKSRFTSQAIMRQFSKIPFFGKKIGMKYTSTNNVKAQELADKIEGDDAHKVTGKTLVSIGESRFAQTSDYGLGGIKLVLDNQSLVAYVKVFNFTKLDLSALVFDIKLSDILNQELGQIKGVQLLDIDLLSDGESGWLRLPFDSEHVNARRIELILTNSVSGDGEIRTYAQSNVAEPLTVKTAKSEELSVESESVIDGSESVIVKSENETADGKNIRDFKAEFVTAFSKGKDNLKAFFIKISQLIKKKASAIIKWAKSNRRLTLIASLLVLSLIVVFSVFSFATHRPLTEEKALKAFYDHLDVEDQASLQVTNFEEDKNSRYEINYVQALGEYELYQNSVLRYERSFFGRWYVSDVSVKRSLATPLLGADSSLYKEDYITDLEDERFTALGGNFNFEFPDQVNYKSTLQSIPVAYVFESEIGTYAGFLNVQFSFDDLEWGLTSIENDEGLMVFTPLDLVAESIVSLDFAKNLRVDELTINGKEMSDTIVQVAQIGNAEPSDDYMDLAVPVKITYNDGSFIGVSDRYFNYTYTKGEGYVLNPKSKDFLIYVEAADLEGNTNLTSFKGTYDFVISDTFETDSKEQVVLAIRGIHEPPLFDNNGELTAQDRKMGDVMIFNDQGEVMTEAVAFNRMEGSGLETSTDIMYNNYEYGISLYRETELFSFLEEDEKLIVLKEHTVYGNEEKYLVSLNKINDTYELVEVHRYEAEVIEEGGFVTSQEAYADGLPIDFEVFHTYYSDAFSKDDGMYMAIYDVDYYQGDRSVTWISTN
ncbi:hypothetical protein QE109_04480 [Fusibacter bizertensis]|uniref:Uncharacterized protein n=1 Tax=Fusibacter bizertensis TaxID=1488331 RepID=A0ABT6NAE6_9FIRM|nr:hypothetical protein [Fusibacter bizertensis]MDH8677391.1 hypothetical protein [Fusibacter bizertensis]